LTNNKGNTNIYLHLNILVLLTEKDWIIF